MISIRGSYSFEKITPRDTIAEDVKIVIELFLRESAIDTPLLIINNINLRASRENNAPITISIIKIKMFLKKRFSIIH